MANTNWENLPSTNTPINATNLNKVSAGLVNISNEVDEDYRVNLLYSKNLVDISLFKNGYNVNGDGTIGYDTSYVNQRWASEQYIPVKNGDKLISNYYFQNYGLYNKNRTFVSRTQLNGSTKSITINADGFIRVCFVNTSSTLNNLMLVYGETEPTSYEAFIPNQIVVDNEKYTDTLNVGSVVDSRSRVNFLKSNNLFDKDNATITNAYFDSSSGVLISGGQSYVTENYTEVEANKTYSVGNVTLSRVVFYNSSKGVISVTTTSTSFTTPANTKYIRIQITTNTKDIVIQEGSSIITPSIYVDNEEIYSKPVVLWTNPSPTSTFAGQEITLNDNIENYSYYEVIYILWSNEKQASSTGKVPIEYPSFHEFIASSSSILVGHRRTTNKPANNKITFSNNDKISTTGTTADNTVNIPVQIIGYK